MELNKIYQGDSLQVLKTFDNESIDCIVTSPPYYGLRDYGVGGQIGQEKTPQEYITNLINIMNECKRVLKKTGSCWVNLGDSYYSPRWGKGDHRQTVANKPRGEPTSKYQKLEFMEKSLLAIPERFVIAMTDTNWIRRNSIIWYKPNCMPSSAKDRFTVDFEYFYFFTKSPKYYFETQYEPYCEITLTQLNQTYNGQATKDYQSAIAQNPSDTKRRIIESLQNGKGRIKRCVWKVTTKPFPEAHFAVFPETLVETPIKACCPPNGVVLDPFIGSGTVGMVAKKQGKNYMGIELKQEYVKMAENRINSIL